jgi:hypothetical protein
MRATIPAGTVSGAPKIRAMQLIADLEGTTRGPDAGCVGYFSFNGNLDTCITIRTALLKDGKACVQAGGGWVNDSEPEAEFQETVNKSFSPQPSPGLRPPSDSLAPARSALAGLRLSRIPFAASQAAQVPLPLARDSGAGGDLCERLISRVRKKSAVQGRRLSAPGG